MAGTSPPRPARAPEPPSPPAGASPPRARDATPCKLPEKGPRPCGALAPASRPPARILEDRTTPATITDLGILGPGLLHRRPEPGHVRVGVGGRDSPSLPELWARCDRRPARLRE